MAGIGDSSLSSFALTPEVEVELLQAFANDASTLARLREQIRRAKEADVVMKELMERREGLIRRNEELRQDAERGLNQAPIIPRASSPTAPHPRREQRLPSVLVTSAAAHDGRRASATAGGGRDDSCILRASPPLSASANELDAGFVLKEFDDHHFDASSAPVPNHWNASSAFRYAYRGPTVAGGVVSSVLRDATLFRVVCEDGSWAFYNDTRCYRMFVHYRLSAGSTVEAGPAATVSTLPSGEMDLSMDVLPEETKVLLTGRVTNFESLCEAIPLTRDDVGGKVSDDTPLKMLERIRQHHGPPTAALSSAEALDICVQHNLPFVDPEFLPSDLSLFRPSRDLFYIPSLKWNQPADFLPPGAAKEVRLFRGPLRMEHVSLGPWLQDSHFVSTVVALHEVAGVLYSLFRHPLSPAVGMVERTLGAYRVQLCCCGWWRSVLVDHMLPSTSSSLLFSCCADDLRKMWLPILEKAFAKMCGSYAAILNASSMAVMASLSGYPCVSLSSVWPTTGSNNNANNNARAFIDLLKEHLGEQGGLVILSTFTMAERGSPDSRLERTYKGLGLRPGHSVVVLGVEVVEGFVLLRLRQNDRSSSRPNNAWLGVWRKEQKPWAEAAGELSFALNDEGCLYMDAVDVPIYFSSGYCVYPFFNGREMRVRSEFIGGIPGICLRIDVKRTTRVAFCLQQCGEPCTAKEDDLSDGLPPEQTDAAIDLHLTGHTDGIQVFIRSSNRPNIFEPNYAKHLVEAQKVAMGAHLTPQHSPYFVIPRSDAVKELPYVLTLFAEDVDEDQSLSVELVKIKGAAPVFRGGQASAVMLKPSTDCKSVAAEYQYRHCGTELIERGKSVSPYAQRY